jgi:general secretion pathway protein A
VYPKYFGLKEPSFSIAPDPHYLFLSEQHREALAHLLYGAGESGGFVLLTGEVGTGKTTVCRAFLEQLPEGVDVALILNPAMTANELLLNICDEFRIPVPAGERSVKLLVDRLNTFLLAAHANGRRPVLLIDEAQNLRPKVMEQVRLLTNLETTKHKLLQIFLVGQPELRQLLEREGLRQINQRITARFHLRPLSLAETTDYIRHRVAVAGVDRPLFTGSAIRRIHQVAGGVPRLVNILCDRALLGACVTRANQVTPGIVAKAAREVIGERLTPPRRPAVRPAFAAAAALMLAVAAGWTLFGALHQDPHVALADTLARLLRPADAVTAPVPAAGPPGDLPMLAAREPGADRDGAPTDTEPVAEVAPAPEPETAPTPEIAAAGSATVAEGLTEPPLVEVGEPQGSLDRPTAAVAAPDPESMVESQAPEELPRVSLASFAQDSADKTLARLAMPEGAAMQVLIRRWGIDVQDLGGGDPCIRVAALGLRCEREQGRLSHVRYFDRPVLLRVRDEAGTPRFVALGALDASFATLDLPGGGSELVPVEGIESVWTGDYTVIWQPPPTGAPLIGPGASSDTVRWLRRQLAALPGSGPMDTESGQFDVALEATLRQFQVSKGLVADGIAGPRTLIALSNSIASAGVPHLLGQDQPGPADVDATTPLAASRSAPGPRP